MKDGRLRGYGGVRSEEGEGTELVDLEWPLSPLLLFKQVEGEERQDVGGGEGWGEREG